MDAYIAAQPEANRDVLRAVRTVIRNAIPETQETMSYNMPAYRLSGTVVIYFAGWKKHFSLYPVGERIVAALQLDVTRYDVRKGTIRFPYSEPFPRELIESIATFRAMEVTGRAPDPE